MVAFHDSTKASAPLVLHFYSVNGRVEHVPIYKRGHCYGSLNNEIFTSVDHCVAVLSRTGFTIFEAKTSVTLTNRLFPDK